MSFLLCFGFSTVDFRALYALAYCAYSYLSIEHICNRMDRIQCFPILYRIDKRAGTARTVWIHVVCRCGFSPFNELNYRVLFDVFFFIFLSRSHFICSFIVSSKWIHLNEPSMKRSREKMSKKKERETEREKKIDRNSERNIDQDKPECIFATYLFFSNKAMPVLMVFFGVHKHNTVFRSILFAFQIPI